MAFINAKFTESKSFYEEAQVKAKKFDRLELVKIIKLELEILEKNILNKNDISTSKSRFDPMGIESYVQEAFKIIKNPIEE